ncbi:MAG: glycosyltransferase [Saprospiraceae bacterium]
MCRYLCGMQLSVIIVNYNVRYFLEQALLSVRKASRGLAVEVWVVDNNSVDSSVAMVREKFPEVRLIANTQNTGFAVANNQAIRQASGKYVLLLNPDTVVEEDTFQKCIGFMDAHPLAGALGVKMIDGSGKFLPESKRGFPTPFVAFCKTFGLSALFPKSKLFNQYYLGFLSENETHKADVLAGAFMFMRREALDKVGLLDEAFFMYGEDIDLSYRIVQGGFDNYYFADTTILHYKGESTKKGSLNYVKTFYQAMIIFAKKHFKGNQAWLFVAMLHAAIYLRAGMTLMSNLVKMFWLPLLDAAAIYMGLIVLKNVWGAYYFRNPDYYHAEFTYINIPLYIIFWLGGIFISGGYDHPRHIGRVIRGLFLGTLLLSAVYGFLPMTLRYSRILILFGAIWAAISTISIRFICHFIRYKNFNLYKPAIPNLVIVGSNAEADRTMQLLQQAQVQKNLIGLVASESLPDATAQYLGNLEQLPDITHIYKVEEIIFCSKDVSAQAIMKAMTQIGNQVDFKIIPQESLSIIGSNSKDTSGELYTIDIKFNIATVENRRNKRLFDIFLGICLLVFSPLLCFFSKNKTAYFSNIFRVIGGGYTWVGYAQADGTAQDLPPLRKGIFTPLHRLNKSNITDNTLRRLNVLYAKNYEIANDLEIVWKCF